MNGRILILDDEQPALDGLRRVLRPLSSEWELIFVDRADQALECMSRAPVDLVLSDLMMPGMKGIQFLGEVHSRFPHTVRLILSGYIDRDLLFQCATAAHRAVAKPCQPDVLLAILRRALSAITSIENPSLRAAVCRTNRLPTQPEVQRELVEKLASHTISLDELSRMVARDVGLAATVLKLANSPVVQVSKHIFSIPEAVACLGMETVRSLIDTASSADAPGNTGCQPGSLHKLWKHSLDTAVGAQTIAAIEHGRPEMLDETFTAGLLHDAGKFLLVSNFPAQYTRAVQVAVEEQIELTEAERRVFGASHADVGAALLGLWGLPPSMLETVSLHHFPSGSCRHAFSPLIAVHVANALVHERDDDTSAVPVSHFDPAHLGELGLSARIGAWRGAVWNLPDVAPSSS